MEAVVDASALLAVVLDEPERGSIIDATRSTTLIAPEVLPFEIGNALTAMRKRGRLEEDLVFPVWDAVQQIPVQLISVQVETAITLALANRIYAYDAYYLQCSLAQRRPLLTLDRKMQQIAIALNIRLVI